MRTLADAKTKMHKKTKFAPKMDSSLLVVKYCKSHLKTFLFEMKQSPEKVMVILEEKNDFDPIKGNEPEKDTDSLVNTLIGGEPFHTINQYNQLTHNYADVIFT